MIGRYFESKCMRSLEKNYGGARIVNYIDVGLFWYNIRMLLELFFFYIIFYSLYQEISLQKKICYVVVLLPATFIIQICIEGFGDILPIFIFFMTLKDKRQQKQELINALLVSAIIPYIISILVSVVILNNTRLFSLPDPMYVFIEVVIELIIVLILVYFFNRAEFRGLLARYSSMNSTFLLCFYYFGLQMFLYAADYYEAYESFILGIALFLILQILFLAIFFVKEIKKSQEEAENRNLKKQLANFKAYTTQLEKNHHEFRKFKHDYKNLILSLKELAMESSTEVFKQGIEILEDYSDNHLSKIDWQFNELENLEDIYIKSLFISKIYLMKNSQIPYTFECIDCVNDISIQVFDLVRILGISLDNAIEATIQTTNPLINIAVIQERNQLEFIIQNTFPATNEKISKLITAGYSTKKGHSGFGLSNIQEIKKKYPNLYVQYEKNDSKFTVQIVLTNEGES